jgi:bacillolysin
MIVLSTLLFIVPAEAFAKEDVKKESISYVALGDSLAAGITPFGGIDKGYPVFLEERFEKSHYPITLKNLGTPSYTSEQLKADLLLNPTSQLAIKNANLITIDIGANDLLYTIQYEPQNIPLMLQKLSVNIPTILGTIKNINPNANVLVMGYYNAFVYYPTQQQQTVLPILDKLNTIIQNSAQNFGYQYVPTEKIIAKNYQDYLPNPTNVHLSLDGYQAVAKEFWKAIDEED